MTHVKFEGIASIDGSAHEFKKRRISIGPFAIIASEIWSNAKICEAGPMATLVFIFALTKNAARGRTGEIPLSDLTPRYIARQTGIEEADAKRALRACVDARLIVVNDDTACIVGWDESWKRAELTAAERIRKADYRRRKAEKRTKPIAAVYKEAG